ncbi:MAG: 6,7-dimethyl-8-ribityllumazine synthase, partial [Acidobacteriota bacterium]
MSTWKRTEASVEIEVGRTFEGGLEASSLRIGIVVARFNHQITNELLLGAVEELTGRGVPTQNIEVAWVPGAFELPVVSRKMAQNGHYDAVICLGAVIRGETTHFEFVAGEAAAGIARTALETGIHGGGTDLVWMKVLDRDELPEGRVTSVTCGMQTICMTHFHGEYGALNNKCPHQGGPLGEGSIENGLLRCPWHGWDYDPLTGKAPGFDDGVETYAVEVREDGVWVGLEEESTHVRTVTDVMAETMVQWGIKHVWGMVGHSNLGLADALRRQVGKGHLKYYGIRHEGAAAFAASAYGKLTGRPAACLAIAGPGATNLLTGLWDAHVDRSPVLALTGQVNTQ